MDYPPRVTSSDQEKKWIYLHVKAVAEEIGEYASRNAQSVLGDTESVQPIMEFAIRLVSRYLVMQRIPLSRGMTKTLLRASFRRRLQRHAQKVNRREMWAGCNDVEEAILAFINGGQSLNSAIDSSRIVSLLSHKTRGVLALRDVGFSWKEIAGFLESTEAVVRRAFRDELTMALEICDRCESHHVPGKLARSQGDHAKRQVITMTNAHGERST